MDRSLGHAKPKQIVIYLLERLFEPLSNGILCDSLRATNRIVELINSFAIRRQSRLRYCDSKRRKIQEFCSDSTHHDGIRHIDTVLVISV